MKILVAVKRVIDPYVKIRVKSDKSGIETQQVKMSMNPFDEIALEEALRLREQRAASEVVLVTVGTDACQETLRHGLALGADSAFHVKTETVFSSLNIAKILETMVRRTEAGFVLMGKQSIDGDNNQTPQMLAALLNWPQGTYASEVTLESGQVQVTREVDGGLETLRLKLPAVVSTDLRLNEPRYATLPNIMKAKKKPLEVIGLADLGLTFKNHTRVVAVESPSSRRSGIKVSSVQELIEKLQHEARVL